MKKLLQLNVSVGCGATGRIAEAIAALAVGRGWDCHIAHGARYVKQTQMSAFRVSGRMEERMHYLKSFLFDAHGLGSRRATERLIDWIEGLAPDVIQLHNLHGYWTNYALLFKFLRSSGIPVVWTLHDVWALTGHCAMFPSPGCGKWKTGCGDCPCLRAYPRSLFRDASARNHCLKKELFTSVPRMHLVTVSHWLKEIVGQSYLKDLPLSQIRNGVDTQLFRPRDAAVAEVRKKYGLTGKIVFLTVADKWSDEIGFSDIPNLRRRLDERFAIVVAGVTERQKTLLPEGVIGILHTGSKDELAELYSSADIAFTPQAQCSFSLVTAEAMACGTPSVVYSPAAAEVMGGNGYRIPPRDIGHLAETLNVFAERGGKRAFGESCVQRARLLFDEKRNYRQYVDLYESLL